MVLHFLPYQPPPEPIQKLNRLLHTEPFASIGYALIWALILCAIVPLGGFALLLHLVYRGVRWVLEEHVLKNKDATSGMAVDRGELGVVISGCDSGFGLGLALGLAEKGYQVFAGCLTLEESASHFAEQPNIKAFQLDVTKAEDVEASVKLVEGWLQEQSGGGAPSGRRLHALVNNAGMGKMGQMDWLSMDDYENCMNVNAFGPIRMCKGFFPIFKRQRLKVTDTKYFLAPRIVNLSSTAGLVAFGGLGGSAYMMSKHAMDAFSQAFRFEAKKWGVAIVSINPSFHNTPLIKKTTRGVETTDSLGVDEDLVKEYGEDYFFKFKNHVNGCMTRGSWDWRVAVDCMMDAVEAQDPPTQVVVGIDAKYGMMVLRMLPEWVRQLLPEYMIATNTPVAIQELESASRLSSEDTTKKDK